MNESHYARIAHELALSVDQVRTTAALLADAATVPFIARYRKEATDSLDEVAIAAIRDRLARLEALDQRRATIVAWLEERQLLTPELRARLETVETLAALEDLYLPFRPKRRTRATLARERGLEPLADLVLRQDSRTDPAVEARRFVTPASRDVPDELRVPSVEEALQGARDIIAERINDNATARARLRRLFWSRGVLRAEVRRAKAEQGARYRDYFDWSEPVRSAPSHRVLAILRGESEGVLACSIEPPQDEALRLLEALFLEQRGRCAEQVRLAVADSYKRLIGRAIETETRHALKERADAAAIRVFAENLRQLLLAPPLGERRVLAIDPGWRTGCKVVVLDQGGQLLEHDVIYLEQGEQRSRAAAATILRLIETHAVEAIAIGNGTAGREAEAFVRALDLPGGTLVVMVNEAGASVYSASDIAREELPQVDITVRGAVSIGRRLLDPLAELVKIDPKSIGVGQYQHDVDQGALKRSLDDVVISCVNAVGVDVNTASRQLLTYVSGLNATIAQNILVHRNTHGPFSGRHELRNVPRLGVKAFEQAAGFLRIRGAANLLDASAVHPESYPVVERMASDLGVTIDELMRDPSLQQRIQLERYVTDTLGLPTLRDILAELARPGRDPRQSFDTFQFAEGVRSIEDVRPGMKLPGIVTNVTAFGAFVDIGVHQDGLVHVSQLADRFVKDPSQVVSAQQRVEVTVLEVDTARKRISLSMRKTTPSTASNGRASGQTVP